jgi:hypothetical protein
LGGKALWANLFASSISTLAGIPDGGMNAIHVRESGRRQKTPKNKIKIIYIIPPGV